MRRPLFSCVIPVKGARPYFEEAMASVREQGMGEALEIIVQDGDVDPDFGQSDALNKGFSRAKGEWLFWLNADDVLLPGALKKVLGFINRVEHIERDETTTNHKSRVMNHKPHLNWLAGDTVYINEEGKVRDVRCDAKWRSWFGNKLSVWTGGPSAFFRRELWARYGEFDTALKYVMDIDLWTRWAKAGERFVGLDDYVWGFRVHDGSKTMGGKHQDEYRLERSCLMCKHGVKHETFWRNLTRIASVFDGSWMKRELDSARLRGSKYNRGAK